MVKTEQAFSKMAEEQNTRDAFLRSSPTMGCCSGRAQ
jgi:hypothetical protein